MCSPMSPSEVYKGVGGAFTQTSVAHTHTHTRTGVVLPTSIRLLGFRKASGKLQGLPTATSVANSRKEGIG